MGCSCLEQCLSRTIILEELTSLYYSSTLLGCPMGDHVQISHVSMNEIYKGFSTGKSSDFTHSSLAYNKMAIENGC